MMPTGEYGIHCWDVCAGGLILREAGGVTMMPTGTSRKSLVLISSYSIT